jgi:hypothetical protein
VASRVCGFAGQNRDAPVKGVWFKPGVPRIGSWSAQATVTSSSAPDSAAYARGRSPLTLGSSSGRLQRAPLPLSLGSASCRANGSQAGTQLTGRSRAEIGAGPERLGVDGSVRDLLDRDVGLPGEDASSQREEE